MYAIIRAGGHQEKVSVGETITVDRLKQDPDSEIRFTPLLISVEEGNAVSNRKELADKGAVVGRVIEHVRGDKIDVFHYKNKTGFRKHTGHRSMLTLVEITEIGFGDKKETLDDAKKVSDAKAAEKAEASKALQEAKEKGKADRKAAAKKKSAAQKTTAAKKTAAKKKAEAAPAESSSEE
jgi:large subunit ribosomal protein L21